MATETTRETDTTPDGTEAAGDGRTDTGSTTTATAGTATTETATTGTAGTETGTATTGSTAATDSTDSADSTGSTDPATTAPATTDSAATDASGTGTTADRDTAGTVASEQGTGDRAAAAGQAARPSTGALAGGGAVVSAGLGLASLTGTSLTDMLRDRQQLIGQIEAATGMPGDQIQSFYGAPWHTAAMVNGVVALIAVVVGAVLMLGAARKPGAPAWARPVALGGVVLGVLGLLVSGGMYLDLFAAQPALPAMPAFPGMGG
ncbi:hypothetical protein SAMN05216207_100423 [Pseudonocardia ammonioxydans]|uniref:Uncharacterized protein n=1 Tax=Pseudonocardia ammonioxydans TaxID=260086 RepID=A0A1I4UDE4_PSUAM|nr:hypothetical protein [Pseudonocardia ammonioxydans]SFM86753.1 hypothetical protein SAMN05216207_100423 [Pseudonocardia ammonioxydans]